MGSWEHYIDLCTNIYIYDRGGSSVRVTFIG